MKKPLVILAGPTAVGKTDLSIKLAKAINGEIISADSMQVYRGMDIGSAKIKKEEMEGIRHYLIDVLDINDEFNVTVFKNMALEAMKEIYGRNHIPIIAGGTGFYIQALLYDIDFTETKTDTSYRDMLEKKASENGALWLHEKLKKVDPESAENIHYNNVKRVIRALEYYKETGEKISEHNKNESEKDSPYNYAYFVLNMDRDILYKRIEKRVDIMLDEGLVDEVKALKEKGAYSQMVSMQGLGYKEILAYLDGQCTLDEAVRIIKQNTRRFAKRQLTWFRREKDVIWIDKDKLGSEENILKEVLSLLKEKNIL